MTDAPPRPAAGAEGVRRWGPLVAWASLLLLVTSWPNPQVPDVQGGDKVVHFTLYGVLAFLAQRAVRRDGLVASVALVAAVSAFGWGDEWHQQFIPGRSRSVADWQADTIGAVGGVATALLLLRRRTPRLS